ncbi:MAG: NYN domain-containing protein [Planctomycetes bacterium]|nr:NYN domain-containing protein [Planctomycetota bacterium]
MMIIDGYNLLFAFYGDRVTGNNVDSMREDLVELLKTFANSKKRETMIVFDRKNNLGISRVSREQFVEIIFAKSADNFIIKEIDNLIPTAQVISTDNEIRKSAEAKNCECLTSEDFVKELKIFINEELSMNDQKLVGLSDVDVDYWQRYFNMNGDDSIDKLI